MIPWTVAHHSPLSLGFPRQEYWSGLPPFSRSSQRRNQTQVSCIAGRFFTIWTLSNLNVAGERIESWLELSQLNTITLFKLLSKAYPEHVSFWCDLGMNRNHALSHPRMLPVLPSHPIQRRWTFHHVPECIVCPLECKFLEGRNCCLFFSTAASPDTCRVLGIW